MSCNFLKLNSAKTEVLLIGTYQQLAKLNVNELDVAGVKVKLQDKPVRNLGVMFDKNMTMEAQVSAVTRSTSYHVRNVSRIRRHLTLDSAKSVVNSLVTSRLDYCNSLLTGVSGYLVTRLQGVQNWAARVVLQLPRSVDPPLDELHWLPVKARIKYKLAVTMFKAVHGLAPSYLTDLLNPMLPGRSLRSGDDSNKLHVPKSSHPRSGDRSFRVAGPKQWNELPVRLRNVKELSVFKKDLKTHFYRSHFPVQRQ